MQHVLTNEVMRRALRAKVCPSCPKRPVGSESFGPMVARACEGTCTVFGNLKTLKLIARQLEKEPGAGYEQAIRNQICQQCTAAPTAGDYCLEQFNRVCPLSTHAGVVLETIESLLPARRVPTAAPTPATKMTAS